MKTIKTEKKPPVSQTLSISEKNKAIEIVSVKQYENSRTRTDKLVVKASEVQKLKRMKLEDYLAFIRQAVKVLLLNSEAKKACLTRNTQYQVLRNKLARFLDRSQLAYVNENVKQAKKSSKKAIKTTKAKKAKKSSEKVKKESKELVTA